MTEKTYQGWRNHRVKEDEPLLTRSERLFGELLFSDPKIIEMMSAPEGIDKIFTSVQKYLKA